MSSNTPEKIVVIPWPLFDLAVGTKLGIRSMLKESFMPLYFWYFFCWVANHRMNLLPSLSWRANAPPRRPIELVQMGGYSARGMI
jgi:hypothetical protein